MPLLIATLVLSQLAVTDQPLDGGVPEPAAPSATVATAVERPHTLHVGVGFSHWYGDTFGAPVGFTTPGINFSVQPGLSWLEVTGAYSLSVAPLPLPGGTRGLVGFALLGVSLVRDLAIKIQRVGIGGGPVVGLVHTPAGVGLVMGARLAARYLIKVGKLISIGPSFEGRGVLYLLPGSGRPLYAITNGALVAGHSDVQVDLSVLLAFW